MQAAYFGGDETKFPLSKDNPIETDSTNLAVVISSGKAEAREEHKGQQEGKFQKDDVGLISHGRKGEGIISF